MELSSSEYVDLKITNDIKQNDVTDSLFKSGDQNSKIKLAEVDAKEEESQIEGGAKLDSPTDENEAKEPQQNAPSCSPEPNCAICLGKLENKSFTDSCFHQFCFTCLLEWSKIKAECPLCKQAFKSIIHNVRSIEDYDQYYIRQTERLSRWEAGSDSFRRFRYPSTLTSERLRHLAFEHRSFDYSDYRLTFAPHMYRGATAGVNSSNRSTSSDYRKNIYNQNLWVRNGSDDEDSTVRYRETSPDFFRQNPACTHRLTPWLNRELLALLQNSENQVNFVLELILALIMRFPIQSSEFFEHIYPYLQTQTTHFVHEFYAYARSPLDMQTYDREAQYREQERSADSPNSIEEVPVEADEQLSSVQRIRNKSHRYPTRSAGFATRGPLWRKQASMVHRFKLIADRFHRLNSSFRGHSFGSNTHSSNYLNLDMPGTSRQEIISPHSPNGNDSSSSATEEDEDCVIVDCVKSNRPPELIDLGSTTEESDNELEIEQTQSEQEPNREQEPKNETINSDEEEEEGERPSRKNRCTFHYDYSSDSEQASASNEPNNKKLKLKSFIGSIGLKNSGLVGSSGSVSSYSAESTTTTRNKKHKKHKKHKHKHSSRRRSKEK